MNTFINTENLVQGMIIIFMFFLCMLCLFAVVVIVRDIVRENGERRRERKVERSEIEEFKKLIEEFKLAKGYELGSKTVVPDPVPVAEPVKETTIQIPVAEVVEEETTDENAVSFSMTSLNMDEKYAMLSKEYKGFFDSIIKHVMSKEGIKENKRSGSYDYKIGSYKVLKMMIKRGEILCEFMFIDREINKYASTSGVKVKQSATVIKVIEPSGVGVVKDGIDMICDQIEDDKEYKRNLAREKRREKRKKQKEESVN